MENKKFDARKCPEMQKLMKEAIEKDMIFLQPYTGCRFTPDQLKQVWEEGRFHWGAVNWRLIPKELHERLNNDSKFAYDFDYANCLSSIML